MKTNSDRITNEVVICVLRNWIFVGLERLVLGGGGVWWGKVTCIGLVWLLLE